MWTWTIDEPTKEICLFLFYNGQYPFDIAFVSKRLESGMATTHEYPCDNSKCNAVVTVDFFLAWTGPEKASDDFPARVPPSIQYFKDLTLRHDLDNLCGRE